MTIEAKAQQALEAARKVQESALDWIEAHNKLYGMGGEFTKLFPTVAERTAFSKTPESAEIRKILEALPRPKDLPAAVNGEASGQIHIRVPRTIHAALLAEAEAENVSLNQLILAKLSPQLRAVVLEPATR